MKPENWGEFDLNSTGLNEKEPIDLKLGKGIEIPIADVEVTPEGLLNYEGRQVLLYIKDHGQSVMQAIENPEDCGRKFHVSDCKTLKDMRNKGKFERYVVTNDTSGEFKIAGRIWGNPDYIEGIAALKVCKLCLTHLNYQEYGSKYGFDKSQVFKGFQLEEFFSTYRSFFPHMPQRNAKDAVENYTADWALISKNFRKTHRYRCQQCYVDLSCNASLLHVHHINGVKSDNRKDNLLALCAICHSEQIDHQHLFVPRETREDIMRLRSSQKMTVA